MSDEDRNHAALITLLADNRDIADTPSYITIEKKSEDLARLGKRVCGVKIERLPRSSANDLLKGRVSQPKWRQIKLLWAILYWIAENGDGLDPTAMHSLEKLRRCFFGLPDDADTPTALSHTTQGTPTLIVDGSASTVKQLQHSTPSISAAVVPGRPHERHEGTEQLLVDASQRSDAWWQEYIDVVLDGYGEYLTLEREAAEVRQYSPRRFPTLLQTAEYARYVLEKDCPGIDPGAVSRSVALQLDRQPVLRRPEPVVLLAIVNERALYDRDIPAPIMRSQLKHLITMASFRNVTMQFIADDEAYPLFDAVPTLMLRFAEPGYGDLVFLAHRSFGHYRTAQREVGEFSVKYSKLLVRARPPDETVGMLIDARDRIEP